MPYLTYFDAVEHLITSSFGGPQDAEQRDIRTAVQRAYSEVTQIRDWAYYHVHGRVYLEESRTGTGTAGGGGAVSFSSALFAGSATGEPASHYTLRVRDINYPIVSYVDGYGVSIADAALTFPPGTACTVFRAIYPLPSDFRNLDEPSDEFNWWAGLYVTPDEAMKIERVSNSSGSPFHWTVIKDPATNGWALKLVGYPTHAETLDFTYRRTARALKYSGHEAVVRQGTIARTSINVTGSGTAFPSDVVGSVLRIGDTTNTPGPASSITPYVSESPITLRSSATSIRTEAATTVASSTKYLITDPIDLPAHMHNVMYSAAEYWLARIRNQKPDNAFAMYQRDLRLAMEMDQLAPLSGRSREIYHDGGWKSPLKPDAGT
jgi:hypothetical protein